jgi:CPA2 family monovalent cation:H+ antiporter-2
MESMLLLATLYLGAAVLVVPLSVRLGLGSVLGYLGAGLLIGPALGLAGAEMRDLQHVAEFGVVMMLFLIGLELDPRALWDMRARLLGLGGAQVGVTLAAVAAVALAVGQPWPVAVVMGMVFALSSTAIVLQTLTEKDLMRTAGGRSAFAVLLAQDLAVVPMLAAIPLLASVPAAAESHGDDGAAAEILSLIQGLPGWAAALLTLGSVAVVVVAGRFLSRPAFRFVHAARLPEMGTFFALFIIVAIAALMMLVGLSPALGAFVAGVVLAGSEFRHQLEADLRPFKGLLLGLFFITVGIGIDTRVLAAAPGAVVTLTLGVIVLKAAILLGLAVAFGLAGRDRWLFAFGLAQAGEFGFLLVSMAAGLAILPGETASLMLLAISLSMLATPALFVIGQAVAARVAPAAAAPAPDAIDERGPVIIAGVGRFGQVVNRLVRTAGVPTVVLDADIKAIDTMRRFGMKTYLGDPQRPELLHAAGLETARVLVVAVDDREAALAITRHARQARPDLTIVARARDRVHVYELYQAGATKIVRELFDSSIRAGRYTLEAAGFTDYEADRLSHTYWQMDRAALRDLAALWQPGQPVHLNAAYIARSRQLDADLETALIAELDGSRREAAE